MAFRDTDRCLLKVVGTAEPIVVLRAADKAAPGLVRLWAAWAEETGVDKRRVLEANGCAAGMEQWTGGPRRWRTDLVYGLGPDCASAVPPQSLGVDIIAETEPIFTLRAQDRSAPVLLRAWCGIARAHAEDHTPDFALDARLLQIFHFAGVMESWTVRKWPD